MNGLDSFAGIALGAFLLTVAVNGKTDTMLELAKRDKAFLQWAIALGILFYLYEIPELKGAMSMLILMAFIGLGITAGTQITENAKTFWNSIGGK